MHNIQIMENAKIDEIDKKILNKMNELQTVKHSIIAKELGLPNATVNKRINKMLRAGVIDGFAPILNLNKLNYNVTAIINVRVKSAKITEAIAEFANDPNVCAVYKITGEYDIAVIGKFRSTAELDKFTDRCLSSPLISRTNTSLVFSAKLDRPNPNIIL